MSETKTISSDEFLKDMEDHITRYGIYDIYQYLKYDDHFPIIKIRNIIAGYLYHTIVKNPESKVIPELVNILSRLEAPNHPFPVKPQLMYFLYLINNIDLTRGESENSFPHNLYL